jgi:proline dehydrogenase
MFAAVSKTVFASLAASDTLKTLASRYGMRRPSSFARRFIAGETLDEALAAAREIEQRGLLVTLDLLGESVTSRDATTEATRVYVSMIEQIARAGVGRNISLKLTQLGLGIDPATSIDNLRRILDAAARHDTFVRIDMENSPFTDATLDAFETVWRMGFTNVGVVIQSCLKRSAKDVERVLALGARIRLVKGAYREPSDVALQQKTDVDAAFIDLMKTVLNARHYPAIATHDPAMIDATRAHATAVGLPKDAFEFQMLYGIRRDLQTSLAAEGYPFRVYVPFGREWFPYFMRRLGERPANVGFIAKALVSEGL